MPLDQRDPAYLWDMLQGARAIREFVAGKTYEAYLNEALLQAAAERKLEVIGEAAHRVSAELQQAHPEIPWHRIIVQRHVLAHEYGEIQQEKIWKVATIHVPELILRLAPLIPSPPSETQ